LSKEEEEWFLSDVEVESEDVDDVEHRLAPGPHSLGANLSGAAVRVPCGTPARPSTKYKGG